MITEPRQCGQCREFDQTTHKAEAAKGMGMCKMPTGTHVVPFIPTTARGCVLFMRPKEVRR